jgi:predicted GIY-YIG superfamily endonuclease
VFKDEVICYIILTHYGTYYTGITNSLIRRWKEHIAGKSSYLSKFTGKEVVHIEWFSNRKDAAKKERYIKKVGAKLYLLKLKYRK